mgnify:FL=1
MKRSPMPARKTPMRRTSLRVVADGERPKSKRPKMTGPRAVERLVIISRAGGSCEVCGQPVALIDDGEVTPISAFSIHHRQPRGMGGSSVEAINTAPNLLLVCGSGTTGCHGLIESQRAISKANGWLVPHPTNPADVPVLIFAGVRVYLTPDGRYRETE